MEIKLMYMTVTIDFVPNAMNLSCWISPVDFFMSEKTHYPFQYNYIGENCTWILHSNQELTGKLIASIGEQADRICMETQARNEKRKIANRS